MKRLFEGTILLTAAVLLTPLLRAQSTLPAASHGISAVSPQHIQQLYTELCSAFRAKTYDDCIDRYEELAETAPEINENMYILAARAYRELLNEAESGAEREMLLNKLIKVYDVCNRYFGDNPKMGSSYILTAKAKEVMRYKRKNIEVVVRSVREAINASGQYPDLTLVVQYFGAVTQAFREGKIAALTVMNEYDYLSAAVRSSREEESTAAQQGLDGLFRQSGAARCENIEAVFVPRYEANPNDEALIGRIVHYTMVAGCRSPFSVMLSQKYYTISASPQAALALGTTFAWNGEYDKAFRYLDEAVNRATDPREKSGYLLQIARLRMDRDEPEKAALSARKAIMMDPNNGMAFYTLAQAYAAGRDALTGSAFDRKMVSLLVADNLLEARRLMVGNPEEIRRINASLAEYTHLFPTKAEISLIKNATPGTPYTFSYGWIRGTTVIRTTD